MAQLQRFTDQKVGLVFTPHLVPMIRGMHATLYARLTKDIDNAALQALFEDAYKDRRFRRRDAVRLASGNPLDARLEHAAPGAAPSRQSAGNMLVILVVQDNLVKGASGQAVQCMNLMFGLPETTGLQQIALLP